MSSESNAGIEIQQDRVGSSTDAAPPVSSNSQQPPTQNGIDIRQALEILSERTPHSHAHKENHGHTEKGVACCHSGDGTQDIPADMKAMGQTIDLFAASGRAKIETQEPNPSKSIEDIQEEQKQKAAQHHAALVESLKEMTKTSDLLRTILTSQEDRVQTYRRYDIALQKVLQSGNFTAYPPACATATASFAMLSETIRAVKDEMETRRNTSANMRRYMDWIQQLQSLEKEKLQLTAALHLEKIRERNQREDIRQKSSETDDANGGEQRVLHLLQEGIAGLEGKITMGMENINDVLEDFRCALLEEVEEEEDQQ
jgi:hypothetical protein